MLYPFDIFEISNQLNGALSFINTYTRNTFPLFFSTQYLSPDSFHVDKASKFPANMGTSDTATRLGIAFFKAFEATANQGWKTLALNQTESFTNHFFLDNIYTQANQGRTTPLVRNHWLVIAYGTSQTEGDQNGNNPFNFGTFANHTFTSGVAQLPSDLKKIHKAFNGILHYQNLFSPLRSGTEYEIDYYVSQGFKIFANGTIQATAEPNGRVKLASTFSGSLICSYSRLNGITVSSGNASLTGESMVEAYPILFKCKEGSREYTNSSSNTFWGTYELFEKAFQHSGLSKYFHASQITKWNAAEFLISRQIDSYYFKKELADNPLRHPGSYVVQYAVNASGVNQTLSGFTISRDTSFAQNKYAKIVINANSNPTIFSRVELQNIVTQTQTDNNCSILVEVASTVDQVIEMKLSLSPDSSNNLQEYTAYWAIPGNSINQAKIFNLNAFLKFKDSSIWNVSKADKSITVSNASYAFIQDYIEGFVDTTVLSIIMFFTNDECTLTDINSAKIPNIRYWLSGNIRFRFKDNLNNYYYADIADTNGTWTTFSSSWQQLGVGDRQLVEIAFQNSRNSRANLRIFYIGDAPESIPIPALVYKASLVDRSQLAHTLWIGDYRPYNNPLDRKPYKPGVVPLLLSTLNNADSGFYGEQYYCAYQSAYILSKWDLKNEARLVVRFWNDAQESYRNQSDDKIKGLLHQVFIPYSPENIPYANPITRSQRIANFPIPFISQREVEIPTDSYSFGYFSWKGLDSNAQKASYNNRAMEDLARYFYQNQNDAVARKILTNYINFIYDYYQTNPTKTLTDLPPNTMPQSNSFDPYSASTEGIVCLFCNLSKLELEKTFWLIQNRFEYISNEYVTFGNMLGSWTKNQPTFTANSQAYAENFSFWHGKIIEFYSECLIYKNLIRTLSVGAIPTFPIFSDTFNSYSHFITEISEPEYPKVIQKYAEGNQQTILLSQNPVGKIIGMQYQNFDAVKVATLINFYNTVNSTSNGQFRFNLTKVNYDEFFGIWVFESVPSVETVLANALKGKFNVSFKIKQIEN
jgi:hypothetical protein